MAKIKLSDAMETCLLWFAQDGRHWTSPAKATLLALEKRGLIRWNGEAQAVAPGYYHTADRWILTLAGWEWLKETHDLERPADEGRMTLEEARADAEAIAEDDRIAAADWDAAYALEDAEALMAATFDAGRYTLDEAWNDAITQAANAITQAKDEDRRSAGRAYEVAVLGPVDDATTLTFEIHRGVSVPTDVMSDWRGPLGSAWRRGVEAAQNAAQSSVSAALPPRGGPSHECDICRWKFTHEKSLLNHRAAHHDRYCGFCGHKGHGLDNGTMRPCSQETCNCDIERRARR